MNISFSSAFQSVQASHSQSTNKVATASTMANNVGLRADVLTLDGRIVQPGTYQRSSTSVGASLAGRITSQITFEQAPILKPVRLDFVSQLEYVLPADQKKQIENTAAIAGAPYVFTASRYCGDSLVSTITQTYTPGKGWAFETTEFLPEGQEETDRWERERFTYKATITVGEKVISNYEGEDLPWQLDGDTGKWITYPCQYNSSRRPSSEEEVVSPNVGQGQNNTGINNTGIFAKGNIDFAGLGKLLGMEGTFTNKTSLLTSLDKLIADEAADLNAILSRKLGKAGLGDVTKKITFAEDKDGKIVIEGNISAKQKRELARVINGDPELVDRIKTQKARMEIAEELKKEDGDVNLSSKKFDAARTQLLSDFLRRHGATLDDAASNNENITALLSEFPDFASEVEAYKKQLNTSTPSAMMMPGEILKVGEQRAEKSEATRSLLSMHRGVLAEATDEERNFGNELGRIRKAVFDKIVDKYNDMYRDDPDAQIIGFNMKIDDQGRLTIVDVQTWGHNADDNKRAEKVMNTWLNTKLGDEEENGPTIREAAKEIGLAMLEAHDAEHGDVHEFKHEILSTSFDYEILSPEADRAALAEMEALTQDIGSALGEFFGKTMGIENPFALIFGSNGLLSLDGDALSSAQSEDVKQALADINKYLTAEKAGEETEGMLSPALTGIAEKLGALKEVMGKFHDKSLVPKDGVVFASSVWAQRSKSA